MKLVVKGVVTAEDAQQCLTHGVDGISVSNHGGRQEESLLSTIEALALGASAVCIGRPYLWGLGAFGQPGDERMHQLLQAELVTTMKLAGTTSIPAITPDYVRRRPALIR